MAKMFVYLQVQARGMAELYCGAGSVHLRGVATGQLGSIDR